MEAEILLQYESARFAKSVMRGILPENKLPDQRMLLHANVTGRTLKITVKRCERMETLQATLQDVFRCLRAAESSLTKLSPAKGSHR